MTVRVVSKYWLSMYADANLDATIQSLAVQQLDAAAFVEAVNKAIAPMPSANWNMIRQYIADRQLNGCLSGVEVQGENLPVPVLHTTAPTGLGQNESAIWFSLPNAGTMMTCWFVDGVLKICREQDTSGNRGATKSELECQAGNIVQCCFIVGDVYGWWGRITIE